ncbi:hypothetical protein L6164_037302 [Bauhinia variegata]|uniref:Uncharacterized protein n=1 Tax=Bauhinia variegata TaxID=167791 RepID=A0ACB9KJW6_BAUVA|nr:hypothetical protein L6164_037302 [Bauhinia variegata]
MYPADSKVYTDYLVECWAAQGFLGDVNDTCYQDVRDKGHVILDDLVNVSLLEKGERKIYVRMHDCIGQLALHISSKSPDCHTYVMTSENSMQPDNSKAMKNSRWVSMIDSKLIDLLNGLGSVMLSTLLLQKNAELAVIQQTFFENMTNLVLLDLYGTRIEELSSSLSTLIALKRLYLNDCMLLTLLPSEIGSLQCLQVLDIREIERLLMFKEVTERERYVLPKLEKLVLNNLPIFKSICTKETLAWPSLNLLEIYDCLALKALPFGMDNAANLRSIKGQKEWWDNLEWTNNKAQEQLQIIFKAS